MVFYGRFKIYCKCVCAVTAHPSVFSKSNNGELNSKTSSLAHRTIKNINMNAMYHKQLQNTKNSQTTVNKTCKDAREAPIFNIKISNIIPPKISAKVQLLCKLLELLCDCQQFSKVSFLKMK